MAEPFLEGVATIGTPSKITQEVLELENTYLSEKALTMLCKVVSEDKTLAKLSLARNNIGIGSVKALAEMLKYNQSLKFLVLH